MPFRLSQHSKKELDGVDSNLISIVYRALDISKVDFGIPKWGGVRTEDEQQSLYNRGASKADGILNLSNHQRKIAVDVFAYVDGQASWEIGHLAQVACAMLQAANELGYKLKWGGLWVDFVDAPHFELVEAG